MILFKPQRSGNWILKLDSSGLSVDLQRHYVHTGVVELDPGQVLSIGTEVEGLGVGQHFLLVNPIANSVEDCARNAYGDEKSWHHR